MGSYKVKANNTSVSSANKMHDDEVAKTYGFKGGLVPGVDVYAYLTHLPAERWGRAWLERGTMAGRFLSPAYDGDEVTVTAAGTDDGGLDLELHDSGGQLLATGRATLPSAEDATPPPAVADFPTAPAPHPDDRPQASPEAFALLEVMGSLPEFGFSASKAPEYLADIRESLPLYTEQGVAHPGWLVRTANAILTANVRMGPWIHVSTEAIHFAAVNDGARLTVRGHVLGTSERKGHKFVELDVLAVAGDLPVARYHHTAIYEPRVTR